MKDLVTLAASVMPILIVIFFKIGHPMPHH